MLLFFEQLCLNYFYRILVSLELLGVSFDTLFNECRTIHSKTFFVQKVQNFFGGFLDIS